MRSFRPSLTLSILAFLSCLLLLTWLLFSLFAFRTAANDLYDQKAAHARMLLATFVNQLPENLPVYPEGLILPNSPAAFYAQKLADDRDFIRLTLLDANGRYIYTAGRDGGDIFIPFISMPTGGEGRVLLPDRSGIGQVVNIVRNDKLAGRAGLVLSLESEKSRLKRSRDLFMAYFAIDFILLLGIGAYILSRIVVKPVNALLSATERITRGHYGHQITVSGSSEMSQLAESFNAMSETLQQKDRQVVQQVKALEKANDELRQAREETIRSEKMASVGLLAAGMAHEIGTPLASIMGYAELLSSDQADFITVSDYAQRISQDCARIDRIVRGLLDYSRQKHIQVEPVDVQGLVDETVDLLQQQGAFKHIQIQTRLQETLPKASADPHQLQQVIINLLINSRDALPDGGKILISALSDDSTALPGGIRETVRLDILDSGTGINPENIGRIFDPFYTTKPPGKGTGLGLAIVSRIIEGLGGRISVQSRPGKGTLFSVWLPQYGNKEGNA